MFSLLHVYLYNLYNCHKLYCLMTIKFWIWIWIWYTDMLLSFRDTIWIAIEMKKKKNTKLSEQFQNHTYMNNTDFCHP
jgi:hypothetical protein